MLRPPLYSRSPTTWREELEGSSRPVWVWPGATSPGPDSCWSAPGAPGPCWAAHAPPRSSSPPDRYVRQWNPPVYHVGSVAGFDGSTLWTAITWTTESIVTQTAFFFFAFLYLLSRRRVSWWALPSMLWGSFSFSSCFLSVSAVSHQSPVWLELGERVWRGAAGKKASTGLFRFLTAFQRRHHQEDHPLKVWTMKHYANNHSKLYVCFFVCFCFSRRWHFNVCFYFFFSWNKTKRLQLAQESFLSDCCIQKAAM